MPHHTGRQATSQRDRPADKRRQRISARAYRRSLPAIFRLRRAAIVITVMLLVGVLAAAAWRDPKGWVSARWNDLRGAVVPVHITGVQVTPSSATAAGSKAANLTDGTEAMWTAAWSTNEAGGTCHQSAPGPRIILTFAPRRVRKIIIFAGAPARNPDRLRQFRPQMISYGYGNGRCRTAMINATGKGEIIAADSRSAVTSLTMVITSTYNPPSSGRLDTLSITDISLRARP